MNRFVIILISLGFILLALSFSLHFLPFNPDSLSNVITSDGSLDALAEYAFKGFDAGLALGALPLFFLAALLYLGDRGVIGFFRWPARRYLVVIIGLQLLLSILYFAIADYKPNGDAAWYHEQAVNLITGKGIIDSHGDPTAFWPAGYPFMLAALYYFFGTGMWVSAGLNLVFLGGMTWLTYLIGRDLFTERTARTAGLVMALFPSQIFYTITPLCDTPFAFFNLLMIYLALKKSSWTNTILLGICYGACLYLRPVIILFPTVILLYRFLRDKQWKPVLLQVLVICLIAEAMLLPWQVRNYRVFKQFVFVATYGGYNLWMGNNPNARGGVTPPWAHFSQDTVLWLENQLSEIQRDQFYRQRGWEYIRTYPLRTIIKSPLKLVHLYLKDSKCLTYGLIESYEKFPPGVLMGMLVMTEAVYYALGLAFLLSVFPFFSRNTNKAHTWIILGTILYFSAIYLPFTGEGRYHQPLLPLFALVIFASLPEKST